MEKMERAVRPYKIECKDLLGRYLVAVRNIKEGELILKERPLMVGAPIDAYPTCFRCCSRLGPRTNAVCDGCNVAPLCHPSCPGLFHPAPECTALKATKLPSDCFVDEPQIAMPFRCALLESYDDRSWKRLRQMESHLEVRKDTHIWRRHRTTVEGVLRDFGVECGDVQVVCGVLDVNSFEVRPARGSNGDCLRALYPEAALMAHDCVCNTFVAVDENYDMYIRASRHINEGQMIVFNYANPLQGNVERKRHLKEGKYFECGCARCTDRTELGTNLSSLYCPKCKTGYLYGEEYGSPWKCGGCDGSFKGAVVRTTNNLTLARLAEVRSIKEAEELYEKLRLTYAPQHYLLLELKQNIIALLTDPDPSPLERRAEHCEDLLRVVAVLEPGVSRLQSITRYELYKTRRALTNRRYDRRETSTDAYIVELEAAERLLTSAVKHLLFEPPSSPEGRLARCAVADLKTLRSTLADLKRICTGAGTNETASAHSK